MVGEGLVSSRVPGISPAARGAGTSSRCGTSKTKSTPLEVLFVLRRVDGKIRNVIRKKMRNDILHLSCDEIFCDLLCNKKMPGFCRVVYMR